MKNKVYVFDSTLRDGSQAQGISFSVKDKLQITKKLDELGVSYIEAGNPGSNPKDAEFFKKVKELKLENSKLCAFGSTRKAHTKVQDDSSLKALINSGVDVICIFGKAWDFHVTEIIKTSLGENLSMIKESIEYLKGLNKEVIFDAEHFFDGYKNNPNYAIKVLDVARKAGADWIVLCDTNGGTLPSFIQPTVEFLLAEGFDKLGVHFHNDAGVAVANSLIAVKAGVRQVQGTFTGLGERCGNANLSTIIGNLMIKMEYEVLPKENLGKLVANYRHICEVSNIIPNDREPYVGNCSFAHKGGMHVDAVKKNPKSFEHVDPSRVGNERTVLMSEVAGRSTIMSIINKIDPAITKNSEVAARIMKRLKELEHMGYQFEGAEGSFELLVIKELGLFIPSFELVEYRVMIDEPIRTDRSSTVTMKIKVNGVVEVTAADGNGPVNALDKALRKALSVFYPSTLPMYLTDYKVRVIGGDKATSAKVRVLIESTDGFNTWTTVGVSHDIIEASWKALVDSVEYKLLEDSRRG